MAGILNELFGSRIDLGDMGHLDALLAPPDLRESFHSDPIGLALLESGFSGVITDSAGHKRTYQDGKQVAGHPDGGDKGGTGARTSHQLDAGEKADLADGLKEKLAAIDPTAVKNPGLLKRIGDLALTAAAKVYGTMVSLTPAMVSAGGFLGDVLDTPDDLRKKFGYNPTMSGGQDNAAIGHNDPLKASLGVSTHFAATVATHVLSRAYVWAKKRLAGGKQESEQDGDLAGLAGIFAAALAHLADEFGLPKPPDAAALLAHWRTMDA